MKILLILLMAVVPVLVLAQGPCPADKVCLDNPLSAIGVSEPGQLVIRAMQGFAGIIGLIAIAFSVFSGFKLAVAASEEPRNEAKESLKWSVGGFVVAILSFTIISGTARFLGFTPSKVGLGKDTISTPLVGPTDPGDFISIMNFIMVNFLGLVGFATTLMFIYYGYVYVTAAGNEESIEQAKSGLKWAVVGLVVTLLSFTIITSIRQYLVFGPP